MIIKIDRGGHVETEDNKTITANLVVMDMGHHMAMYYAPVTPTEVSNIAVMVMHCDQNYMGFNIAPELAKRGYHVMAVDAWVGGEIDRKCEHLSKMVKYMKAQPGIDKVILMGHSGGATLMTAYQAIAEKGAGVFQGDNMIYKCTVHEKLEPADGIMLLDANYGNAVMSLLSLDPAVVEEGNGMKLDPKFDIFDPANGYDKNGANYSPEFIRMYQKAQRERNERLIDFALERLEKIKNGEGNYVDDEPFMITAADQPKPNNRLLPEDLHLLAHTKGEYDLIHADTGEVTHEQVKSLRAPEMDRCFSNTYGMGVNKNTIKGFLSSQAIRTTDDFAVTEDDVLGVDWNSSYASPIGNIEHISVPAIFMGMTGGYEYMAAEIIYNHAKMADKEIAFVRGASHNFVADRFAEKLHGSFGDTEKAVFDHIADWMKRKFA